MTVANCRKCRRIFQRTISPLCPACHQESMGQVSQAYRFIQDNPHMTLEEISEHCEIPFKELEDMFFAGKLGTATKNVIYHCQRCNRPMSAMLRRGRFCLGCAEKIETEGKLNNVAEKEKEKTEKLKPIKRNSNSEEQEYSPVEAAGHPHYLDGGPAEHLSEEHAETEEPVASTEAYGFKRLSE